MVTIAFDKRFFVAATVLSICVLVLTSNSIAQTAAAQLDINRSSIDLPLPRGVDKQTGYRMGRYRAAVPDFNPGTEVVDALRALELYKSGLVKLIDVYPPTGLGANPMDGRWMTNEKYETIEGAIWLPEVGRGHVEQEHIDYFQRNLVKITGNDKQTPLMFFCTSDCWQSWNAARRALLWGYENIFWYPQGTDGWSEHNQPLVPVEPVNFLGEDAE